MKRSESDKPFGSSLKYLTKVRPRTLRQEGHIIDPYVKEAADDLLGFDSETILGGYTRSMYTLEGHYKHLWNFGVPITPRPTDPVLDEAIEITRRAFRLDNPVDSITWDKLDEVPFIPTSSAGWNYTGKKGDGDNHAIAIRRAVGTLNAWIDGYTYRGSRFRMSPDIAFTRTQLGSIYTPKVRHVWGAAFENIILEGMGAAPLIKAYQDRGKPLPIGIHIYKRLPIIIQNTLYSNEEYRTGIGTDIKAFDSSVQPWLIDTSFSILKENLRFKDPMDEYAYLYSIEGFKRRPVVMPDGRMWLKVTGLPSGSYYTQLIGSVANHIVTTYSQLKVWSRYFETWVLGDDSIYGVPLTVDPNPDPYKLVEHYAALGFTLHPDKTVVSQHPNDFEFLGHTARGSRVDREMARTLRLALYPEYPVTGPADSLTRVRGLMLDSGLNSWPIIQLNDYMTAKYAHLAEFDNAEFSSEDKNWMHSVVGHHIRPKDIDIIKAWTFT